jgi:phage baseplate assembly protein W
MDMNAQTGRAIDGLEDLRQSVHTILTTPLGSRVMRRDFGSLLPELIDQPLNDATLLRAYSAAIIALLVFEPRLRVNRINKAVSTTEPGRATFTLAATTTDGTPVSLDVPLTARAA